MTTKTTGDTLEALVRKSAALLEREGLRLKQTGAIFKGKVGPGGQARGRIIAKGDLDFVGDYRGRAVSFDAKSTKRATSFQLALLKKHQVTICKNAHQRGAIAFFLIEFSALPTGSRYFALTWDVLADYWQAHTFGNGEASIPLAVIASRCVEVRRSGAVLDLVGAIEALQESTK